VSGYLSNERIGLAWLQLGIWRLREKENAPSCNEQENVLYILLKCNETNGAQVWREEVLGIKWPYINE
jgi:hypothetical protein